MQKISIADYFKRELNLKHSNAKLKEMQKLNRESYTLKLEKQDKGREGMFLYFEDQKGLIAFLDDYLELFDPNVASTQDSIIIIDGKIRELINGEQKEEYRSVKPAKKTKGEEKYTVSEIKSMFSEFVKLEEAFAPRLEEIEKWFRLREIFKEK